MTEAMDAIEERHVAEVELFRALSHPVRLAILDILRDGEQCVCHMEATLGLRQAYISQHLMVLREAGLVADRKDGWNVFYHVANQQVFGILDAVYGARGKPRPRLAHKHGKADCPCPKCNAEQEIPLEQVNARA